jgi:glycolate oxidase
LERICGSDSVLSDPDERLVYECDAYPLVRNLPGLVVFPMSTEATSQVVAALRDHEVSFVPRGAGTSLAGGCLTGSESVMVCTSKMKRILEVDLDNECAVVEAGVITQEISDAVAEFGYFYAPDPSSQSTSTIGGNVATGAGGPHTLKYGVTGHHVLGLTVVLPSGEVLPLGGRTVTTPGYDLGSVFIGSEGTLGLITEVTAKLTRSPCAHRTVLAVYDCMDDASNTVRDIIAAGIVPAALEMMDQAIVRILEDAYAYGFPRDAEAVLVIEIDGIEAGLDSQLDRILRICRDHRVRSVENAASAEQRAALWKARKTAFGALGRAAPTCITQDGVVPRSELPGILRFVRQVADKHHLRVASNFHAGDGNIHPSFLFDRRDPGQVEAVQQASHEILAECVRVGGTVTGEHGIGVEKTEALRLMFNDADLAAQRLLKGVFDPADLANSDKIFASDGQQGTPTES